MELRVARDHHPQAEETGRVLQLPEAHAARFLPRRAEHNGWAATLKERLRWSKMRMDPTDFADVTGYTYTYLLNGLTPDANWTGVFRPGETVRLRFIDAGAMTYFDVRIPGLKLTVVQVDGQHVQPVEVDEFRIAPGETYDILVQPEDRYPPQK